MGLDCVTLRSWLVRGRLEFVLKEKKKAPLHVNQKAVKTFKARKGISQIPTFRCTKQKT